MAKGDSGKSQLLIRNYAMERFLERVALSKYKDNFILKGGMLVSALVGLQNRTTMDIDTTIRNLPLDSEQVKQIADGLKQVSEKQGLNLVITTGLGKDILDAKAAESLGLEVKSMGDILTDEECVVAPAVGTAVMMNKYLN